MNVQSVIALGKEALTVALLLCLPPLGLGLIVGLTVSILQAVTQIQDQSLAFIPKILAVAAAIFFFGPWMLSLCIHFTGGILGNLSQFAK
ncbi:MAG: flagellar biosynthesis protein FliQ [bacterium]